MENPVARAMSGDISDLNHVDECGDRATRWPGISGWRDGHPLWGLVRNVHEDIDFGINDCAGTARVAAENADAPREAGRPVVSDDGGDQSETATARPELFRAALRGSSFARNAALSAGSA